MFKIIILKLFHTIHWPCYHESLLDTLLFFAVSKNNKIKIIPTGILSSPFSFYHTRFSLFILFASLKRSWILLLAYEVRNCSNCSLNVDVFLESIPIILLRSSWFSYDTFSPNTCCIFPLIKKQTDKNTNKSLAKNIYIYHAFYVSSQFI